MGLGWAGNASDARRSIEVTLAKMSHRNATTKQAVRFRPTLRGGVLLGPPRRRSFSAYRLRQVCLRRRFLMEAKNQAVAAHRLLGQTP